MAPPILAQTAPSGTTPPTPSPGFVMDLQAVQAATSAVTAAEGDYSKAQDAFKAIPPPANGTTSPQLTAAQTNLDSTRTALTAARDKLASIYEAQGQAAQAAAAKGGTPEQQALWAAQAQDAQARADLTDAQTAALNAKTPADIQKAQDTAAAALQKAQAASDRVSSLNNASNAAAGTNVAKAAQLDALTPSLVARTNAQTLSYQGTAAKDAAQADYISGPEAYAEYAKGNLTQNEADQIIAQGGAKIQDLINSGQLKGAQAVYWTAKANATAHPPIVVGTGNTKQTFQWDQTLNNGAGGYAVPAGVAAPAPIAVSATGTAPWMYSYVQSDTAPPDNTNGQAPPQDMGNGYWLVSSPNASNWTNQQVLQNLVPQIASQYPNGLPTDQVKAILDQAHQTLVDQQTAVSNAQSYAENVANQAQGMAQSANDMAVGAGTSEAVQAARGGNRNAPIAPLTSLPYDPATFAQQQASQAYDTAMSRYQAATALAHKSPAAQAHLAASGGAPPVAPAAAGAPTPAAPPPNSPGPDPNGPGPDYSGVSRAGWGIPPYTSPTAASGSGHTITINIGGSGGPAQSAPAPAVVTPSPLAPPPSPFVASNNTLLDGSPASPGGVSGSFPAPTPSLPPYTAPASARVPAGVF